MATLLLERDAERAAIEVAIDRAQGDGAVLAITGPAGCGKSALLALAGERASEAGMAVHGARGSELEREFAFGGVRQLFERSVARLPDAERAALLHGAAALAGPPLGLAGSAPRVDDFAAMHGLYWLLANLAERRPVLLAVDDAQWLDAHSLRWLAYVAARLGELRVLIALTLRQAPALPPPEVGAVLAEPGAVILRPAPLGDDSVAALIDTRLGERPEPAFTTACHRATGGNPFLVRELVESLAAAGVAPTGEHAERVQDRAPETVSRSVLDRLGRLGEDATALARAVAVAGEERPLREYADLAGLSVTQAEGPADALAVADLLEPVRPLRFVHPLVRTAIYESLAPGERSAWHARAATRLAADGAAAEAIGAQLLRSEPRGSAGAVGQLRDAARAATARGAPETAVAYLRRALAEVPAASQPPELKRELGRAELRTRDLAAADRLLEAFAEAEQPRYRGEVGLEAADALMFAGRLGESFEVVGRLRDELDDCPENRDLTLRLDAWDTATLFGEPSAPPVAGTEELRRRALSGHPAARPLCLQLAHASAIRGDRRERVVELVTRGYDDGRFLAAETSDHAGAACGVAALVCVDEAARAAQMADAVLADARRRGLALGYVAGTTHRGLVWLRTGRLADAESDLTDALERAREHELAHTLPFIAGYLADALRELGREEEALAVLRSVEPPDDGTNRTGAVVYHEARGKLYLAAGDREGALGDLRALRREARAMRAANPAATRWRLLLAAALAPDDREEAQRLAAAARACAGATQVPTAIGVAERSAALLGEPERRVGGLRRAIAELRRSPARLELAHALVDLGAALRAAGERAEARALLVEGLDLAHRCGATPLVERAGEEARAAGARPRRPRISGVEALTPSELRVARLAAAGSTNREIAEQLFVTVKTVKDHLGAGYRKLGIASRRELPRALEGGPATAPIGPKSWG